ncbi:unnamed protein product [Adineta steineri]|uniref:Uncharacterized protein n=1 Tax=Adineta steineri TaxID=433720 RepID=A0A820GEV7_9BILA|nr:unnamed protein product [Adineta steineri]
MVQQMVMQQFVEKEYYSGTYQFRFQIERLGIPEWVFFGIRSKHASLKSSLYKTPTVYDWAGHHHHHQYDGFKCEMDINYIIELFIDYDRHKIRLTNESIFVGHEINVSTIKCPLPLILYIGLYGADDQIRLQLA